MDPKSTPDVTSQPSTPVPAALPALDVPADVTVEDADEIRAYLAQHPDLIPLVPEVCREARRQLGDEVDLVVRINRDPEFYDPYVKIVVRFPRYDGDQMNRLDQLRDQFIPALEASTGWFNITTDFRRVQGRHAV
jgi:hypothetical protein